MNNSPSPENRGNRSSRDPMQRRGETVLGATRATGENADRPDYDDDLWEKIATGQFPKTRAEAEERARAVAAGETSGGSRLAERAKNSSGARKFFIGASAAALAALIAAGLWTTNHEDNPGPSNPTAVESTVDDDTSDYENMEIQGIRQGYGEYGMFLDEDKPNPVSFACARKVKEVCHDNPVEMVEYTAENQVESLSAYIPSLPPKVLEKYLPEFSGLTASQTEQKLESLDAKAFDEVMGNFKNAMESSFTHKENLPAGEYDNAYMTPIDEGAPINNKNMKLVKCTTYEDGTEVTVFEWFDENGNSIGTMMIKTSDEDGCMQVVVQKGSPILEDLEEIVIDGDSAGSETSGQEPTGQETSGQEPTGQEPTGGSEGSGDVPPSGPIPSGQPDVKDPAAEIQYAGDYVDKQQLVPGVTPITNYQEVTSNFDDIEQQRQQDAAAKAQAEKAAAAQAAAERQAAAEAEQRRQAQAEAEAAVKAQAEQAAKAAAEQQAAAERAAAQKAQQEADAKAAADAAAAAARADDTASDRSGAFNNGDF